MEPSVFVLGPGCSYFPSLPTVTSWSRHEPPLETVILIWGHFLDLPSIHFKDFSPNTRSWKPTMMLLPSQRPFAMSNPPCLPAYLLCVSHIAQHTPFAPVSGYLSHWTLEMHDFFFCARVLWLMLIQSHDLPT